MWAKRKVLTATMLGLISLSLLGCGAISTEVSHHNLQVQTQMSSSIFLLPIDPADRIMYLQVTNTSDQQSLSLQAQLIQDLTARGWRFTNDPSLAKQILQINVLQAGRNSQNGASDAVSAGFGAALVGGAAGAVIGRSGGAALAGGVVGGLGEVVADAMVQDVTYTLITDMQLTLPGGNGQQHYQTRVVSTADKVNLNFAEAEPVLSTNLAQSIANLFGPMPVSSSS